MRLSYGAAEYYPEKISVYGLRKIIDEYTVFVSNMRKLGWDTDLKYAEEWFALFGKWLELL